ncbi:MAG TPA: YciI family protein [Kribbella sp.]|nr:YciI family protein [Kribbella sp.]
MKYILLAYTKQAAWDDVDVTSPEFLAMCQFYEDLGKELTETGEFVTTEGLGHPALSSTVRPTADGPVAVDGPFAEAKEVLASYAIIDCSGRDRALEIAARIVAAVGDTVEVRPVMEGSGADLP